MADRTTDRFDLPTDRLAVAVRRPARLDPTAALPLHLDFGPTDRAWERDADRVEGLSARSPAETHDARMRVLAAVCARYACDPAHLHLPVDLPAPPHAAKVRLEIVVEGLRHDRGLIAVSLFDDGKGFPSDPKKAIGSVTAPAHPETAGAPVTLSAGPLVPGVYALSLLHDENGNGKMDSSLGFPLEGFGFSNNPRIRFGPPSWDACRFRITAAGSVRRLVVKAVYLTPDTGPV